jgi:hypothetical protein
LAITHIDTRPVPNIDPCHSVHCDRGRASDTHGTINRHRTEPIARPHGYLNRRSSLEMAFLDHGKIQDGQTADRVDNVSVWAAQQDLFLGKAAVLSRAGGTNAKAARTSNRIL